MAGRLRLFRKVALRFRQTVKEGFCKISPLTCNQISFDIGRATRRLTETFQRGMKPQNRGWGLPSLQVRVSSKENSSGASPAPVSLASTLSGNSTRLSFDISSVSREGDGGAAAIVGGITRNQPVFHPNTEGACSCLCV